MGGNIRGTGGTGGDIGVLGMTLVYWRYLQMTWGVLRGIGGDMGELGVTCG